MNKVPIAAKRTHLNMEEGNTDLSVRRSVIHTLRCFCFCLEPPFESNCFIRSSMSHINFWALINTAAKQKQNTFFRGLWISWPSGWDVIVTKMSKQDKQRRIRWMAIIPCKEMYRTFRGKLRSTYGHLVGSDIRGVFPRMKCLWFAEPPAWQYHMTFCQYS